MEGAYHKILQSRSSIPSPQFQVFLDLLVSTVRDAIAVCFLPRSTVRAPRVDAPPRNAEEMYAELSVNHASRLLMFSNQQEFITCVSTMQRCAFFLLLFSWTHCSSALL